MTTAATTRTAGATGPGGPAAHRHAQGRRPAYDRHHQHRNRHQHQYQTDQHDQHDEYVDEYVYEEAR
ncbi:hypothetical protein [Streptomyces longispororuber]|uniref:hypothetical protein n=1 Tax=Streptomyces longispororuber TaxID=68230 RepID=UPI0036F889B9